MADEAPVPADEDATNEEVGDGVDVDEDSEDDVGTDEDNEDDMDSNQEEGSGDLR